MFVNVIGIIFQAKIIHNNSPLGKGVVHVIHG